MNSRSTRGRALPAAALLLALIAVVAFVASGALGRVGDSGRPTPSATPSASPAPTPKPTPNPTPSPTAEPTETPDGIFNLDLDTVDDHDVSIIVEDRTGTVVEVSSGDPRDGMSVRWFDMLIENVDDSTIRLTWVGLPVDEVVRLFAFREDGKLKLVFVQSAPPINSDAMGYDRILVVKFDGPVAADDITWTMQEGLDTPG